ncbi:uncharacterized protein A4U43_C05F3270 [Asparagus officinalis]|uniref:Uncharacterized protein n=1 Tax=Asparagus officinalis TaxID=4686 RepID=A0A5P1EP06_ASPOF|nr:uncharacterized protein C24B11.05-like [Asparagus officinalis]ONK67742.1 uncharacterized protein A4U43_C05F3270 [Asparagus officinalis]
MFAYLSQPIALLCSSLFSLCLQFSLKQTLIFLPLPLLISSALSLELNLSCTNVEMDHAHGGKFDCLLFDLDDTLYPFSSGISAHCTMNIEEYMLEKLGIEKSKISEVSNLLYKHYGTTMAGLRAIGYKFDYDEYHSFVHGRLPYDKLKSDLVLRQLLLSLPIRKVIFTNGDKLHAARVLSRMGIEDCFEGIICFETLNPLEDPSSPNEANSENEIFDIIAHLSKDDANVELPRSPILCKPSEDAMIQALKIANIDPQRTIFFDDSIRNIVAGKHIGLHTVLVGTSNRIKGADYALESIHNIKEALPELWEEAKKSEERQYSGKVSIETSVTA